MKKVLLLFIIIFYYPISFSQLALDNAGNYSEWTNGSNFGSGFGNWDLWVTNNAGWFLGQDAVTQGFGNINTSGKAFGLWGKTTASDYANAQRGFSYDVVANENYTTLQDGHTFKIVLAAAYRSGNKGIDIFQSDFTNKFNFSVSNDKYFANGTELTTWSYSQTSIFTIEVTQESGTKIWVKVTRGSDVWGPTAITTTARIGYFKCYCGNTLNTGDLNNLYFNSMEIRETDPMPVELTSFAAKQTGSNVTLNWKTATEVNNYGFEIQKSNDNSTWNKIGFVQGAGNSNSPKEYSYTDKLSNLNGKFYYRLKQMDNDGTISFSKVVEVENLKPSAFNLSQNYPNPFNPSTVIKYQIPVDSRVSIKVYNVLGNVVATLQNGFQTAGEYSVRVDGSNLASGVYFYKIEAGDFSATKKMLLTK